MPIEKRALEELRQESPESVVRTYFRRWDAHEVEGMMALLGDWIVFNTEQGGFACQRQSLVPGQAWAMAAGLQESIVQLAVEGECVRVVYDEQTEIDRLLGVGARRLEMEFTVRDGIIHQAIWVESGGHDGQEFLQRRRQALEPFIRWVETRHPWEAEELFWQGKLNLRGYTLSGRIRRGRRLVELLKRYRMSDRCFAHGGQHLC